MAGKTSLIQRFVQDTFSEHGTQTTLSWDFKLKTIYLDTNDPSRNLNESTDTRGTTVREPVKLSVWDTAG